MARVPRSLGSVPSRYPNWGMQRRPSITSAGMRDGQARSKPYCEKFLPITRRASPPGMWPASLIISRQQKPRRRRPAHATPTDGTQEKNSAKKTIYQEMGTEHNGRILGRMPPWGSQGSSMPWPAPHAQNVLEPSRGKRRARHGRARPAQNRQGKFRARVGEGLA